MLEAVVDMLDQLEQGKWRDELGHDVRMNVTVICLKELVDEERKRRQARS